MYLRFTYLYFPEDKLAEAKHIYLNEVAPVIRQQPGNQQVLLLEPAEEEAAFISFSLWETEADIKAFETSNAYPSVFGRMKELAIRAPEQKYYTAYS